LIVFARVEKVKNTSLTDNVVDDLRIMTISQYCEPSSKLPGFYNRSIESRLTELRLSGWLDDDDLALLKSEAPLLTATADHMIENVIGRHSLPLGLALNFIVNGREVLVPMAIEEPSVVAGASFMAKLARYGGGFSAQSSPPEMIGQMQVLNVPDLLKAETAILENKTDLLAAVEDVDPVLKKLGGGPRDIVVRIIEDSPIGSFLVLHLIFDVRDAMGANAINTATEKLAPQVEAITQGKVHLRILSNLADRRLASASCTIPLERLGFDLYSPEEVRDGILAAWAFAVADPYRAATHNKGIMNGIDSVVIASGNDWRAVEAGAHAYAARNGTYTSLSTWSTDVAGNLVGNLELPMAVGIVGGATQVHPLAKIAIKLMKASSAAELAEVIVSVGLAQNLAALRALSTEGIQRGHMELHARQVAMSAGAKGEMIEKLARQLISENRVHINRAGELLLQWQQEKTN
jgi:hydroxymethylglutaryl-CoA reductase